MTETTSRADDLAMRADEARAESGPDAVAARILADRFQRARLGEDDRLPVAALGSGDRTHYLYRSGYTVCGAGNRRFGPPVPRYVPRHGALPSCRRCAAHLATATL